jgi:hypothetical protein
MSYQGIDDNVKPSFLFFFMKNDLEGHRLRTTALSRTSVTTFISWVLVADVAIVNNGIPFFLVLKFAFLLDQVCFYQ